ALPRPLRPEPPLLGRDAQPGAELPAAVLVDGVLPGYRDLPDRAVVQPGRRGPERGARPAPLTAGSAQPYRVKIDSDSRERRHSSGTPRPPSRIATMPPTIAHRVSASPKAPTAAHSAAG